MTVRRDEVALIAGLAGRMPYLNGGRITIELTPAQACRRAEFELRHGIPIEQVILTFLDDELFNTAPALPAPAGEPSTIRD